MTHPAPGRTALAAAALLCAALQACLPTPAAAQRDSATVVAGARYRAGPLHELLLGRGYRDLWTAPVRVPVLEPDTFAGGLTVLQEGGGFSTRSLRMRGRDGREYVFRSVDKDVARGFGPEMRGTLAAWIVQDQVAAKHPAAALAVPPVLAAAGVLHAVPRLFVMPDHPFLGEHRAQYAGLLGMVEERPNESGEDGEPAFAGAERVAGTERLLEHLEESPENRVASRAFLAARLVDLFLGDWDRHEDQWRWARFDEGGVRVWHPVPRDRDNVFVSHGGALISVARDVFPRLIGFGAEYPDVYGLTVHATPLDRRLLSDLPRPVWDSTAAALRARITDAVIDSALAQIPPEYRARRDEEVRRALRARRDRLPEVAAEFYAQLAGDVDVHATDEDEASEVDRRPGGEVEVRLYLRDPDTGARAAEPYFRRVFRRGETREVRVYLRGGDDRAVVRGDVARSVGVRVIGGGGDDVLVDSSRVRGGGRTALYDHRGENRIVAGPGTTVDTRRYEEPADSVSLTGERTYRDWGRESSDFTPWAGWRSNVGVLVGVGPVATRYGFRREPYARRTRLRGVYAPATGRFGVEAWGDFRRVGSGTRVEAFARATDVEVTRFHGFGNETGAEGDDGRYLVGERQLLVAPLLHVPAGSSTTFHLGPVARWSRPRVPPAGPAAEARPRGTEAFGLAGARGGVALDTRDSPSFPRRGVALHAGGTVYPAAWGDAGASAGGEVRASTYLTAPVATGPTLALRAGGRRAWGAFPLQEAAFLGGSGTVRGYPEQRFAGEGAVFGNAELRLPLFPVNLGVRGELGALALADAGRVFADGERSSRWHTAYGGGVWVSLLGRSRTFGVSYARGDAGRLYFWSGFPF